jgi:D-tyrosyl-tRNA(Tyr) deacylase
VVRVVAQRVRSASVTVDETVVAAIERGLALLVGIEEADEGPEVDRVADKVAVIRLFDDEAGKMNLSTSEIGGSMLVVSQFTLYGDVRKGRRPSYIRAARPEKGNLLYQRFIERLRSHGYPVCVGIFGANMLVAIENDGPVTIILDSTEL